MIRIKKRQPKAVAIFFVAISLIIIASGIFLIKASSTPKISETSQEIFTNETALKDYLSEFGFERTINHLNDLSSTRGDCHQVAHKAGRLAYQLYGNKVFQAHASFCHSGGYHGATEAYFAKNGTDNLSQKLKTICAAAENSFFSHQCLHGIGHGLMAWTNYEINDALKVCEVLGSQTSQGSCYTGVFMENIVGGLVSDSSGHATKYLNSDPQYPCNFVDDKYKSSCYFLQTSRMLQIFGTDFEKVTNGCQNAPPAYRTTCFSSMGRDVGGTYRGSIDLQINTCANVTDKTNRISCLTGAVQDSFWDPSGQDQAISFCNKLDDKVEESACYSTILVRAPDVLSSPADMKSFCEKIDTSYYQRCVGHIRG